MIKPYRQNLAAMKSAADGIGQEGIHTPPQMVLEIGGEVFAGIVIYSGDRPKISAPEGVLKTTVMNSLRRSQKGVRPASSRPI
jgi:hypothetical protein